MALVGCSSEQFLNARAASLTFDEKEMLTARVLRGASNVRALKLMLGVSGRYDPSLVEFDNLTCTVSQ